MWSLLKSIAFWTKGHEKRPSTDCEHGRNYHVPTEPARAYGGFDLAAYNRSEARRLETAVKGGYATREQRELLRKYRSGQ